MVWNGFLNFDLTMNEVLPNDGRVENFFQESSIFGRYLFSHGWCGMLFLYCGHFNKSAEVMLYVVTSWALVPSFIENKSSWWRWNLWNSLLSSLYFICYWFGYRSGVFLEIQIWRSKRIVSIYISHNDDSMTNAEAVLEIVGCRHRSSSIYYTIQKCSSKLYGKFQSSHRIEYS